MGIQKKLEPHEFLDLLLPQGQRVLAVITPQPEGSRRPFATEYHTFPNSALAVAALPRLQQGVEDASAAVLGAGYHKGNGGVYNIIGTPTLPIAGKLYKPTSHRWASNCVAFDADLAHNEEFATQEDLARAVVERCRAGNVPFPTVIVLTGGGVHLYYAHTSAMDADAHGVARDTVLAQLRSLSIDFDASPGAKPNGLMRMVGSRNLRYRANDTVVAVQLARPAKLNTKLAVAVATAGTDALFQAAIATTAAPEEVDEICLTDDLPNVAWEDMQAACPMMRDTMTADGMQRVGNDAWMPAVAMFRFVEQGQRCVHTLCQQDPRRYDEARIDNILQGEQAPPTCSTLGNRTGACATCSFGVATGYAKNPVIATRESVRNRSVAAALSECIEESAPIVLPTGRMVMHIGTGRTRGLQLASGAVDMMMRDPDGEPYKMQILGSAFDVVARTDILGVRHLIVRLPRGTEVVKLSDLTGSTVQRKLSDMGMPLLVTSKLVLQCAAEWFAAMDGLCHSVVIPQAFGMTVDQDERVFVTPDRVIRSDGSSYRMTLPSASGAEGGFGPVVHHFRGIDGLAERGTPAAWAAAVRKAYPSQDQHDLLARFAVAMSLASPIAACAPMDTVRAGAMLSLYGVSGAGKSEVLVWAKSVWGDPQQQAFVTGAGTAAGARRALGALQHVPLLLDEMTLMADERVGEFVLELTAGTTRAMAAAGSKALAEQQTWDLSVIATTNVPIESRMMVGDGAVGARVMEFEYLPVAAAPSDAERDRRATQWNDARDQLGENYGAVGPALVAYAMANTADMLALRKEAREFVKTQWHQANGDTATRFIKRSVELAVTAALWAEHAGCAIMTREDCELIVRRISAAYTARSAGKPIPGTGVHDVLHAVVGTAVFFDIAPNFESRKVMRLPPVSRDSQLIGTYSDANGDTWYRFPSSGLLKVLRESAARTSGVRLSAEQTNAVMSRWQRDGECAKGDVNFPFVSMGAENSELRKTPCYDIKIR